MTRECLSEKGIQQMLGGGGDVNLGGDGGSRIGAVTEGRGGRIVNSTTRRAYQRKGGIRQEIGRRPVD